MMRNQNYGGDDYSSDEEECPLCMEVLGEDDKNFFPCSCRYQVCRFCWHRIRTEENGLCPACRKEYSETPADFTALSAEELQKIRSEKKHKKALKRQQDIDMRRHLANVRVVQKNLVYVIGLPHRVTNNESLLRKNEFFGRFGKIQKVVINKNNHYNSGPNPTVSAYITFARREDASSCVRAVDKSTIDGRILRASLGTTKYCSNFLRNQACPNPDCMYLHELGDESSSYTKQDMLEGKHASNVVPDSPAGTASRASSGGDVVSGGAGSAPIPIPAMDGSNRALDSHPRHQSPGPWGSPMGDIPVASSWGDGSSGGGGTVAVAGGKPKSSGSDTDMSFDPPPLPAPVPLAQPQKQSSPLLTPHAPTPLELKQHERQLAAQQQQQQQSRRKLGRSQPDNDTESAHPEPAKQTTHNPTGTPPFGTFPASQGGNLSSFPPAGLLPDPLFPSLQSSVAEPVDVLGDLRKSSTAFDWQTPMSGQDLLARLQQSAMGLPPLGGGPIKTKEESDIDFDPWAEMSRGLAQDLMSETNQLVSETAQSLQAPPPTLISSQLQGAQAALSSNFSNQGSTFNEATSNPPLQASRFAFARPGSRTNADQVDGAPGPMPAQFQQQMRNLFPGVNINFTSAPGHGSSSPQLSSASPVSPQVGAMAPNQNQNPPMMTSGPRNGGRGRGYAGARGRGSIGRGGQHGAPADARRPPHGMPGYYVPHGQASHDGRIREMPGHGHGLQGGDAGNNDSSGRPRDGLGYRGGGHYGASNLAHQDHSVPTAGLQNMRIEPNGNPGWGRSNPRTGATHNRRDQSHSRGQWPKP